MLVLQQNIDNLKARLVEAENEYKRHCTLNARPEAVVCSFSHMHLTEALEKVHTIKRELYLADSSIEWMTL